MNKTLILSFLLGSVLLAGCGGGGSAPAAAPGTEFSRPSSARSLGGKPLPDAALVASAAFESETALVVYTASSHWHNGGTTHTRPSATYRYELVGGSWQPSQLTSGGQDDSEQSVIKLQPQVWQNGYQLGGYADNSGNFIATVTTIDNRMHELREMTDRATSRRFQPGWAIARSAGGKTLVLENWKNRQPNEPLILAVLE